MAWRVTPPLEDVAKLYLQAEEHGDPPLQVIGAKYDRRPQTVSKWAMKAREAGLLPATSRGHAGYHEAKRCPTCGASPSRWQHPLRTRT